MSKVSNYSRRRESAQNEGGADYAAKREELVRIAARLFKEQGYQATKLADIAREAGMDRATVYYYVGSKEEFFRVTVEGVLDANIAEAQKLIDDSSLTWLERLHAIYLRLMVSYEENYPATFVYIQEQMHQVGADETPWAQEIMKKTRAFDKTLISLIREAIASGDLRANVPPRLVENALFGMLNWTHRWFTPGGPMTGLEVAEAFWSIFIDGMRAAPER
ncbi:MULTISPECIES: TetR/AcrR family transcriptional regulator [Novosphingobium]|jgi:AcrR family transcriptional regulator|uniref:TetR/AcrR family transcriptional regulator n=1 Tax=Novosphingobium TaxID=165696 RepID=UPI0022F252E5|nr:TetR/AcrR family transcriptional regulator [Novosphingobium resinovorum]GLK46031.1 TetR family transcriptional regulator [Novosphingobium resinovorum]